jgi:tRNA pseudouridine55 synthase
MVVAIKKPKGMTSHDVVNRIRRITGERRVGHAGTLDPMAEGVLVIGIGRESTKKLGQLMLGRKTYEAEITLGATSTTDDAEGELTGTGAEQIKLTSEEIKKLLAQFEGTIQQVPPIYSAIKRGGTPAYKLARQGRKVELGARTVTIDEIRLVDYNWPRLVIEVDCQKGVYIRSLARDIGEKLSVGGYLTKLVRTRVGEFTIDKSMTIEAFAESFTGLEQSNS